MSVPVGVATYFILPDTPHTTRSRFLTDEQRALAIERIAKEGKAPPSKLTFKTIKRILSGWKWYAFVAAYVVSIPEP